MTRKDWEKIETVLRHARKIENRNVKIPDYPSSEYTRRVIAQSIGDVFNLTGEARKLYSQRVDIPYSE